MQEPITQITCYHDGACPLCRLEIRAMQRLDVRQAIHWVDISQDRDALEQAGLSYEQPCGSCTLLMIGSNYTALKDLR